MAGLTLENINIGVEFNGKNFFAGIKKFNKQISGLKKPVKSLNSSFNGLFKVAGIAGLTAMTLNAAKLGREMGLISRKTGVAVEHISSMQNAFAASGGDAKEVSRTLDRITTGLSRVAMGDASFTSSLASMGISAWEDGRLKDAEKIRMNMADWIKEQLDAGQSLAEIATFMSDTFGMSQAEVEHLSVGSKKLLEIQKKYNKEIGVLSKEESQALNNINNSVAKLRTTVGVTFDKLISASAPLLETALSGVQEVFKFVQDNKDIFGPILTGLAGLSVALKVLPGLFSAIYSHPLVVTALAGAGIGAAVGKNEKVNEVFNEIVGEHDLSNKARAEQIVEMVKKGQMDPRQAGIALEQLGVSLTPKEPEKLFEKDIIPTFPKLFDGSETIKADTTQANGNTINVNIEQENNYSGVDEQFDLEGYANYQARAISDDIVKAANGRLQ